MQLFRLMGMPDKVIGFNELPKRYLEGLEMCDCSKLGRSWRDFIGKVERIVQIKPELDPITRQMRTFPSLSEKAPFAYLIDWEINHDKERWSEIVAYVRQHAPVTWEQEMLNGKQTVRMMDDLEKMAKPLARDVHAEVDLEPEDVYVVPLPKVEAEDESDGPTVEVVKEEFKCDQCDKVFDKKQAARMHKLRKHPEPVTAGVQ